MKNYLVFYGENYYPAGGMSDFIGDFDTLDEAISEITKKNKEEDSGSFYDVWAEVYSLKDKTIIYKNEK